MAFETSRVSRRKFLRNTAAASATALTARGIYSLLEEFEAPPRVYAASTYRQEQYLIDSLELLYDNNVTLVVPPLYNDVFTAKLAPGNWNKTRLVNAQKKLEAALARVQQPYPATAAGLTVVVGWGLPYFVTFVPGPWEAKGPRDLTQPALPTGKQPFAVIDAVSFPSDPDTVVLEDNHVAFKLRSDKSATLQSVEKQLFTDKKSPNYVGDLFTVTSKRIGFLGRGFDKVSVAKTLAKAAGVPSWYKIPDNSQLMLGFTSTQADALGPDNIANFETLPGVTDQFPNGYFVRGCAMHLSHLTLDLDSWYRAPYDERVHRMMSARTTVPTNTSTVTIPNGPDTISTLQQVKDEAAQNNMVGHNSALQTATRTPYDIVDNWGYYHPRGTAVPIREDFNTLDNPFSWYVDSSGAVHQPPTDQPGLHFAVFVPASTKFHTARRAMDGAMPDKTNLGLTQDKIGFNSIMKATHRQNFVVPPRAHRSFPLAELL